MNLRYARFLVANSILVFAPLSTGWAQVNDSCASPLSISGPGPFAFNNTAATTGTEGQSNAQCLYFGSTAITRDLWYVWTANQTGTARVSLCALASFDSKVAVYAGSGCPTAGPLACNDDSCGLQSQLVFGCSVGTQY